jgi:hypothetical protein
VFGTAVYALFDQETYFAMETRMKSSNVQGGQVATAPAPSPIDLFYVSELLEVALSILERRHDRDLAQKTIALRDVMETSRKRPDVDCREVVSNALADLTRTVRSHLDTELEFVAGLWTPHIAATSAAPTARHATQK